MIKVSIHAPARGATLFAGAAESDTRVDCVQYFLQKERKPYLILDARYERVRENGVIRQQAVMIAIGVTENGIREIIGVELQNRESYTSWKEFLIRIKDWGLSGVKLIISDNHEQWLESRYLNMDILREKKIEERMVVEEIAA